jgi:hypothetical protein
MAVVIRALIMHPRSRAGSPQLAPVWHAGLSKVLNLVDQTKRIFLQLVASGSCFGWSVIGVFFEASSGSHETMHTQIFIFNNPHRT